MNLGEVETDIPVNLDNLHIGERYTFYRVDNPNVGIRATLVNITPGHGNILDRIVFRPDVGPNTSVPLHFIERITQSGIAPDGIRGLARRINRYLGGRKKRKKRKSRKTKRRRRKKKKRIKTRRKRKKKKRLHSMAFVL